jgi:hypothetical protein
MYADDIVLMSPSLKGLQELINSCASYGNINDILFNEKKSVSMYVKTSTLLDYPKVTLADNPIDNVNSYKYLGHIITDTLVDDEDILARTRDIYKQANMLKHNFKRCSKKLKILLFKTYMNNVYCCSLWYNYSVSTINKLFVAYNNAFRILFNIQRQCSISAALVQNGVKTFKEVLRYNCVSLFKRFTQSNNLFLNKYNNFVNWFNTKFISTFLNSCFS